MFDADMPGRDRTEDHLRKGEVPRSAQPDKHGSDPGTHGRAEDYRLLVDNSPDAILVECDSAIVFANPAALVLFGASIQDALLGRSLTSLIPPSMQDRMNFNDDHPSREELALTLDGRVIDVAVTRRRLEYLGRPARHMVARDISERKRLESQLQHQATHDPLTGLPNRQLLIDRLHLAIAEARRYQHRFQVAFIDLDRFKWINDTFGHEAGDALLKTVAMRMSGCLRESDTIARLGGDEFVLVLRESGNGEESAQVLERVIACASMPITIAGQEVSVTCSIGCCVCPDDGDDPESLLRLSDAAMYGAKEGGRNRMQRYSGRLDRRFDAATVPEQLCADMQRALERDEFVLHYQVQVDLQSSAIVGIEALLRWQHPARGLLEPPDFMQIAEDTGLIDPIGEWVIREACRQNKAWQDAGLASLPVAINLSTRQLEHADLEKRITDSLASVQLAPQCLELELSESASMDQPDRTLALMQNLRELGLRISVDDFGTGFSNLPLLQRFPLERVKLDGSIVKDITRNPNARAAAEGMISLAHRFGMQVIAEMVETQEQVAVLATCECDQGQGNFFSAPLGAAACAALLRTSHTALDAATRTRTHPALA